MRAAGYVLLPTTCTSQVQALFHAMRKCKALYQPHRVPACHRSESAPFRPEIVRAR